MRLAILAVAVAFPIASTAAASPPRLLADPFQDRAVLQRDKPVALWGQAAPGERLSIALGESRTTARAGADGKWRASLPAMKAGGPYRLTVRTAGGAEQKLDDILIGDVWLCSGQSNMVLQVHRALDSRVEIAGASDSDIRMMTVPNDTSLVPIDGFKRPVSWQLTSPATVPEFSAACYFFASELRKTVKVPMGLVNASWGGSAISSWMDEAALRRIEGLEEPLSVLADYRADPERGNARWGALWQKWWRARSGDAPGAEPWSTPVDGMWKPVPAFTPWENWPDAGLGSFNGMLWYRTSVMLTAAQAAGGATLRLGSIEDVDQSFVNGQPIGNTSAPGADREYALPAGLLRPGENSITVNVLDTYGTGGMTGPAGKRALHLADGTALPLDTGWFYRAVPTATGYPPRTPWEATGGLSTIGNAMIAPLGQYAFKGALWYQGESDVERADSYAVRLAGLMRDWRQRFGADLPFLIVQIAGYGAATAAPADSSSARLREAQRRAVEADGNAALAVTIDIGERTDIHPANKQELARRLARAARHLIYGEAALSPSGPRPLSATRAAEGVIVRFGEVERALVSYSAARPIGFELCDAAARTCRFVDAGAVGDSVTLDARGGPAERVRFCWADSPVCNLYDGSGLPVGPFELPIAQ
ncbi:sialate O-acetylesterase [Sphingomonas cavernae]|uniref:9-O-acetylesterase n=1 Tax=Sphingomonas cavernae TaxID=2320861 RepID=A0A418WLB4_9SPHN|nr:sialate O-acetylesterase [Sphingomonas cavernae]RJF90844.1 9-O-acetylesterase [Sphingomonas cavernae]